MSDFLQELAAYEAQHGKPDRIELLLCDVNAVLRGKWLPGDQAEKLAKGAVRLPHSTYVPTIMGNESQASGVGIAVGDPDGILVPIEGTLKPVPWAEANVAQVQVEMTAPGSEKISDLSTRQILKREIDALGEQGLRPVVATELEFYLVRARTERADPPIPASHSPDLQNYDLEAMDRQEAVLNEIRRAAEVQQLATDTLIAEYGPGQFEINFHHTNDVLNAADTALLFRRLVRAVAYKHGMEATFMAKPYRDHPGNGMHVHASLVNDDDLNIFTPSGTDEGAPSSNLKDAVAGVLATMREFQALFAPHLNSYRRFQPNSFAPATPNWGIDNRAAAVRLPETVGPAARLEHRISGADVNPYLALAAILYGIRFGLEKRPDLPPSLDGVGEDLKTKPLGHDWATALEKLGQSAAAKELLGRLHEVYLVVKNEEIAAISTEISPAEFRYYLSRL